MIDLTHPVVIGFSGRMSPFEQLWPTTHRALLPVVGKQIIVHNIERLRNLGHRNFRIADHLQQPFVQHRLKNGDEWGVALRYSDLSGTALLLETVSTFGEALYVHGDELIEPTLRSAVSGEALVTRDAIESVAPGVHAISSEKSRYSYRALSAKDLSDISSVESFHQLAIRSCENDELEYTLPGSKLHRSARSDWKALIAPDVLVGKSCFVGKHCRLKRGVALLENCVLGNGVYVDKSARLRNCVVLPNTYIGVGVELEDAVVSPKGLVHLNGQFAPATDNTKICATRDNQEQITGLPRTINIYPAEQQG